MLSLLNVAVWPARFVWQERNVQELCREGDARIELIIFSEQMFCHSDLNVELTSRASKSNSLTGMSLPTLSTSLVRGRFHHAQA